MVYLHVSVKLHLPAINVCLYVRGDVPTTGFSSLCTYTHTQMHPPQATIHIQKSECKEKYSVLLHKSLFLRVYVSMWECSLGCVMVVKLDTQG